MWVILLASALAQLVSCLVTCPVEAVRIRVMTCDKRPEFLSFVGTAREMLEEGGVASFWSGLGALCFRELPFAIAKVGFPAGHGMLAMMTPVMTVHVSGLEFS